MSSYRFNGFSLRVRLKRYDIIWLFTKRRTAAAAAGVLLPVAKHLSYASKKYKICSKITHSEMLTIQLNNSLKVYRTVVADVYY